VPSLDDVGDELVVRLELGEELCVVDELEEEKLLVAGPVLESSVPVVEARSVSLGDGVRQYRQPWRHPSQPLSSSRSET
jgi:hypothetical protein